MTEKDLLEDIKELVGKREVSFDELLSHLYEEGFDITEDELKVMLAKAGMLAPQVTGSPLMVRVKEGVEKIAQNQNPNQAKVLERMKQGPVMIPSDQNPRRNKN